MSEPSAHQDHFTRDHLPPPELWPEFDFSGIPELAYPERMNCATELLDKQAETFGTRPVFYYKGETWTYSDLLEKANRIAHVLVDDLGLVPGNRVMLRSPNNPMYVAAWFAVMKAGCVAVATMPLLRSRELKFMSEKAAIEIAICDKRLCEEMETALEKSSTLKHVVYFYDEDDSGSLEALMAKKPADFENVDTARDDVCLIAFTSGTTGEPKGCMHFHRDIMAMCDTFSRHVLKPEPGDIFTGSPPVAFTFGLGAIVAFPMHAGASTVLVEQFTPDTILETVRDKKVTVLFTAPVAYRAMCDLVSDYDISSLRKCVSAGEALPLPTWQGWHEATGLKIIDGIGSTEMIHIFIASSGDGIRPGSTGKPIPGYRAKVVDDTGREVPRGTVGRLAVQGPTGCRYLDNIERQEAYVRDGWNYTGDAYLQDEDGYFWFQARTDDMIVSAGYNISGPEIESVLMEHPKVLECGVIGAQDPQRGTIVKAFVVLRDKGHAADSTVRELQDFVKTELAPYKYPRAVEFIEVLPRTQTGKVQRFKLRERD